MRAYMIVVPHLSSSLSKIYHKNVEVYEGDYRKIGSMWASLKVDKVTDVRGSMKVVKGYKDTFTQSTSNFYREIIKGKQSNDQKILIFDNFEKARISKYLLLQELNEKYDRKIEELNKIRERNIPNTQEELAEAKSTHPELFI